MTWRSLVAAAIAAGLVGSVAAASAGGGTSANSSAKPLIMAVIGDTPYGADQADPATFQALLDDIAADPKVRSVVHVGDIKNGSTRCDDAYFDQIATVFAASKEPVVYTPGDNEWTDCHRPDNGGYDPYGRLDELRSTFFDQAGKTLGRRPMTVTSQGGDFVENVRWIESRVVFTTVHVVGSNNGLAQWTGDLETPENAARREAEVAARIDAATAWIDQAFDAAESTNAEGVVLAMQADTFETTPVLPGFVEIVER
ncbi:MAG: metallophosphoesterase, partial [Actinomycetota bacterium]|nr:metallophosphoesterase [Actinomycetota bacterium]